jgi:hypothetical protein
MQQMQSLTLELSRSQTKIKSDNNFIVIRLLQQANQQANVRVENDPWVELVQSLPSEITEGTLKQICLEIFEDIKEIQITTQMTRRLSTCLLQAGWKREGRYSSGLQRNQARFIRSAEDIADAENNAHEANDF